MQLELINLRKENYISYSKTELKSSVILNKINMYANDNDGSNR